MMKPTGTDDPAIRRRPRPKGPVEQARALKTNLASRHVLEKAGFVFLREDLEAIGNRAGEATVYYRLEMPKWS